MSLCMHGILITRHAHSATSNETGILTVIHALQAHKKIVATRITISYQIIDVYKYYVLGCENG